MLEEGPRRARRPAQPGALPAPRPAGGRAVLGVIAQNPRPPELGGRRRRAWPGRPRASPTPSTAGSSRSGARTRSRRGSTWRRDGRPGRPGRGTYRCWRRPAVIAPSALLELARVEEAFSEIELLLTSCRGRAGCHRRGGRRSANRSVQAVLQGRLQEAEQIAAEAFALGQQDPAAGGDAGGSRARCTDPFQPGPGLTSWSPRSRELFEDKDSLADLARRAGAPHKHLGHPDDARREFGYFVERDFENLPKNTTYMSAIATLAEVCPSAGDAAAAARLYAQPQPLRGPGGRPRLGLIGAGGGRLPHGRAVPDDRRFRARRRAPGHRGGSLHWRSAPGPGRSEPRSCARLLLASDGDRDQAGLHLGEAMATAEELGPLYLRRRNQGAAGGNGRRATRR